MNYNFLLINIYIKSTLRFGPDLMQLEKTLGVEQRTGMSIAEISDERLAGWLAVRPSSSAPGMSFVGQLGGAGESLRPGHAGSAEGPG